MSATAMQCSESGLVVEMCQSHVPGVCRQEGHLHLSTTGPKFAEAFERKLAAGDEFIWSDLDCNSIKFTFSLLLFHIYGAAL